MNCKIGISLNVWEGHENVSPGGKDELIGDFCKRIKDFSAFPRRLVCLLIVLGIIVLSPCIIAVFSRCISMSIDLKDGQMEVGVVNGLTSGTLLVILAACLLAIVILLCGVVWAYGIWSENQRKFLKFIHDRERYYMDKAWDCLKNCEGTSPARPTQQVQRTNINVIYIFKEVRKSENNKESANEGM